MADALLPLLLATFGLVADGLILAALYWPCFAIGRSLERELHVRGYRAAPPDGRTGVIIFLGLLIGVPALIVLWGTLTGRLPP